MTAANPALFDGYVDDYEAALHQGLALAGESRDYFARERIAETAAWVRAAESRPLSRVLDFGCGTGDSTPLLLDAFPQASLVGVDVAEQAVARAARAHGQARARFAPLAEVRALPPVDLVYTNGVFHHVPPAERPRIVHRLIQWLRPGGWLALWENNPWNPGTRLVMARIPFDRDAITLTPTEAGTLLRRGGFRVATCRFRFYFPRSLARLRWLERFLTHLPLGGQYCLLARKPATA
jgi:SAM-dependent methyltransferase